VSSTESPSVAGSLIAALEGGGELVDVGGFSIDAGQALIKLREHQLVDPHAWVLLVIEAAVLAGAKRVSVPTEGELAIELGPLELRAEELEQLFAWVFVELDGIEEHERRRRRALQQLALASNAALRLEPSELVIESIDPQGQGARLRMTRERPLGAVESVEDAAPGTRMRAVGLVGERERGLVRERCRYTTHDVRLGDERISRGPSGAIVDAEFEQLRDQAGFAASARTRPLVDAQGRTIGRHGKAYRMDAPPALLVVSNGVLIERVELEGGEALEPSFVAVVELDLPRDLSQAKIRRGPEFESIVETARAAAKKVEHEAAKRPSQLELASGESIGPRLLYSLMATLGCLGGFIALSFTLADVRGAFVWCLGLSAIGAAGIVLLRRRPTQLS
jgi:hypothetical protein